MCTSIAAVFTYLMSSLKQSYAYFNAGNYEVAAHAKLQSGKLD